MKPGTLCIIEPYGCPLSREDAILRREVRGLIATTRREDFPGMWCMSPPVKLAFETDIQSAYGELMPAGQAFEHSLPVSWLRPIRGDYSDTPAEHETLMPADDSVARQLVRMHAGE